LSASVSHCYFLAVGQTENKKSTIEERRRFSMSQQRMPLVF
jgi:hypothetical protein